MSRIFSPTKTLDNDPLLPLSPPSERSNSISLQDLPPQASRSPGVSPSPPPSFYRSKLPQDTHTTTSRYADSHSPTLSPSPSRTKARRSGSAVQFAGPPPPIASSAFLPRHASRSSARPNTSGLLDGAFSRRVSSPHISAVTGGTGRGSGGASHLDPLLVLSRRERAIQKEIQELLDAQSAGLVQGFGGADDGASEAGSSTPTYDSTRSRSAGQRETGEVGVVPVRQPKKKVVGLRGARRGLLRDIGELAVIKGEEVGVLSESIAQRQDVLRKLAVWEERIALSQNQLSASSTTGSASPRDEEGRELAELKNEEKAVDNEIREMEDRLAQMKARRKWIQERVSEGENRKEARLSSYRGALREAEGEVREFLRRPPRFTIMNLPGNAEAAEAAEFTQLPASRRNLRMAKELWTREITQIQTSKVEVEKERDALYQGATMWEESARAVMAFEDELRKQMKSDVGMQDPDMLRTQVKKMGEVVRKLQVCLEVAERKGWNLLICALAAELEAFREGEAILRRAVRVIGGVDDSVGGGLVGKESGQRSTSGSGIEEMNGTMHDGGKGKSVEREESGESEDDGPNLAELLVDHSQETVRTVRSSTK